MSPYESRHYEFFVHSNLFRDTRGLVISMIHITTVQRVFKMTGEMLGIRSGPDSHNIFPTACGCSRLLQHYNKLYNDGVEREQSDLKQRFILVIY